MFNENVSKLRTGSDIVVTPEFIDALEAAIAADEAAEAAAKAESFDYSKLFEAGEPADVAADNWADLADAPDFAEKAAAAAKIAAEAAENTRIWEEAFPNRFNVGNTVYIDGLVYIGGGVRAGFKGWGKIAKETEKAVLINIEEEDGGGVRWFAKSGLLFDCYDAEDNEYFFNLAYWLASKIANR